ncbi:polysaccharide deacetylase family protein [Mesohalobacter halotolerans]|uniref:Polysaccharide deacetylase family protein n=1 Tax=Mesohalobacter halotolerans TaxID=1883405 RepID=A0A4U5TRY2_9FLAO|nr:polysaccharide deacetylase family protein [Mesohalobacter halotolerans]MBS3738316.1 polysaccharide deacetylase family protein [Psychroflexus sp.]TKS56853.1 polysaccharide deacetylase family protein [Mesohalobacter halotolerans]
MIPAKTPTLVSRYFKDYIWDKPNSENEIYLTFDDGPIPEVTPWVLEVLKQYQIKATFFCVGENIEKHPEIFKQILAQNHAAGNHTYNHLKGWKTSAETYLDNIQNTQSVINTFGANTSLFRPPYGKMTTAQSKAIINLGFDVIMWSVLGKDYSSKLSPQKVYDNIINNTTSGSIIVCHDNIKAYENLQKVLPKAIETLLEKGFVFGRL